MWKNRFVVGGLVAGMLVASGAPMASAHEAPMTESVSASAATADLAPIAESPDCIACVGGVSIKRTVTAGPYREYKRHIKYLTGAWAKSTGYNWSSTTTATATVDGSANIELARALSASIGVSVSQSQSWSVGTDIYADRTRYSRLTLKSDVDRRTIKTTTTLDGRTSTKYNTLRTPIRERQFLVVVYQ